MHRIRIETPTEVRGAQGGLSLTWSPFAVVYAAVTPMSGLERVQAPHIAAEATHQISTDYLAGVTVKMQVRWQDRLFDIQRVETVSERNRETRLVVRERLN